MRILKIISSLLVTAFILQDISFANPDLKVVLPESPPAAFSPAHFPSTVATIESGHASQGRKFIYLIQDAHTNESAQKNIAKALDLILEKENICHVFLEAGTGNDSLSYLRKFSSTAVRRRIAGSFLARGYLQGPDYLDLTSEHNFTLWGVEDKRLYQRSVELYRSLVKERSRANAYLDRLDRAVGTLKKEFYHPLIFDLDNQRAAFLKNNLSFTEYFDILSAHAKNLSIDMKATPHLAALQGLKKREDRLDFNAASSELREFLNGTDKTAFKVGADLKETEKAFWAMVEEKVVSSQYSGVREKNKELKKYLTYLKAAQKLNTALMLREKDALEKKIRERLFSSQDEKEIAGISEKLEILRRFFNLKLTADDYETLQMNPEDFDSVRISGFLNDKIRASGAHYEDAVFLDPVYENVFDLAKKFYDLTLERDKGFVRKLLDKMNESGELKAVLVAGGYHAGHLEALLEKENIGYCLVMPQIDTETNIKKYESILLGGQKTENRRQKTEANQLGVRPAGELTLPNGSRLLSVLNKELGAIPSRRQEMSSQGSRLSIARLSGASRQAKLVTMEYWRYLSPEDRTAIVELLHRPAQGGTNDRSIIYRLRKPLKWLGQNVRQIQIKGYYVSENTVISEHNGLGRSAMDLFQAHPIAPQGGMTAENAQQEFTWCQTLARKLSADSEVVVKMPIAWGTFPNILYKNQTLGFVILGIPSSMRKRAGEHLVSKRAALRTAQAAGRALAWLHRNGIGHGFFHGMNFSYRQRSWWGIFMKEKVGIHDLDNAFSIEDPAKKWNIALKDVMLCDLLYALEKIRYFANIEISIRSHIELSQKIQKSFLRGYFQSIPDAEKREKIVVQGLRYYLMFLDYLDSGQYENSSHNDSPYIEPLVSTREVLQQFWADNPDVKSTEFKDFYKALGVNTQGARLAEERIRIGGIEINSEIVLRTVAYAVAEALESMHYISTPSSGIDNLPFNERLSLSDLPYPDGVNIALFSRGSPGLEAATYWASTGRAGRANFLFVSPINGIYFGKQHPDRVYVREAVFLDAHGKIIMGRFKVPLPIDAIAHGGLNPSRTRNLLMTTGIPLLDAPFTVHLVRDKATFNHFLREKGLPVPPFIDLRKNSNPKVVEAAVLHFAGSCPEGIVVKPTTASQGYGVKMFDSDNGHEAVAHALNLLDQGYGVIVQKRISNSIWLDEHHKPIDWNLRVLTTWHKGRLIVSPRMIEVRYQPLSNNPVNKSKGAEVMLLPNFFLEQNFSFAQQRQFFRKVRNIVREAGIKLELSMRKGEGNSHLMGFHTGLIGWDLIQSEEGHWYIMEANVGTVGGIQTIEKLLPAHRQGSAVIPFVRYLVESAQNYRAGHSLSGNEFEEALKALPMSDDVAVLYNLGVTFSQRKEFAIAEAIFRRAMVQDQASRNVFLLRGLGSTLYDQGKYEEAIAVLHELTSIEPEDKEAWNGLGLCYAKKKEYEKAEQAYWEALNIDNRCSAVWLNLLQVLYILRKNQEAEFAAQQARLSDPSVMGFINLATVYMSQQRYAKAQITLKEALRLDPRAVDAWVSLGRAYELQLRHAEAEDVRRLISEIVDGKNFPADLEALAQVFVRLDILKRETLRSTGGARLANFSVGMGSLGRWRQFIDVLGRLPIGSDVEKQLEHNLKSIMQGAYGANYDAFVFDHTLKMFKLVQKAADAGGFRPDYDKDEVVALRQNQFGSYVIYGFPRKSILFNPTQMPLPPYYEPEVPPVKELSHLQKSYQQKLTEALQQLAQMENIPESRMTELLGGAVILGVDIHTRFMDYHSPSQSGNLYFTDAARGTISFSERLLDAIDTRDPVQKTFLAVLVRDALRDLAVNRLVSRLFSSPVDEWLEGAAQAFKRYKPHDWLYMFSRELRLISRSVFKQELEALKLGPVLRRLAEEDERAQEIELLPMIESIIGEKRSMEEKLGHNNPSREVYRELAGINNELAFLESRMGPNWLERSKTTYLEQARALHSVQWADKAGVLPVSIQDSKIFVYLWAGEYGSYLKALRVFLGEAFIDPRVVFPSDSLVSEIEKYGRVLDASERVILFGAILKHNLDHYEMRYLFALKNRQLAAESKESEKIVEAIAETQRLFKKIRQRIRAYDAFPEVFNITRGNEGAPIDGDAYFSAKRVADYPGLVEIEMRVRDDRYHKLAKARLLLSGDKPRVEFELPAGLPEGHPFHGTMPTIREKLQAFVKAHDGVLEEITPKAEKVFVPRIHSTLQEALEHALEIFVRATRVAADRKDPNFVGWVYKRLARDMPVEIMVNGACSFVETLIIQAVQKFDQGFDRDAFQLIYDELIQAKSNIAARKFSDATHVLNDILRFIDDDDEHYHSLFAFLTLPISDVVDLLETVSGTKNSTAGARLSGFVDLGPVRSRDIQKKISEWPDAQGRLQLTKQIIFNIPRVRQIIDEQMRIVAQGIATDTVLSVLRSEARVILFNMMTAKAHLFLRGSQPLIFGLPVQDTAYRGVIATGQFYGMRLVPLVAAGKKTRRRFKIVRNLFQGQELKVDENDPLAERSMNFFYDESSGKVVAMNGSLSGGEQPMVHAQQLYDADGSLHFWTVDIDAGKSRDSVRRTLHKDLFDLHFHPHDSAEPSDGDLIFWKNSYSPHVIVSLYGSVAVYVQKIPYIPVQRKPAPSDFISMNFQLDGFSGARLAEAHPVYDKKALTRELIVSLVIIAAVSIINICGYMPLVKDFSERSAFHFIASLIPIAVVAGFFVNYIAQRFEIKVWRERDHLDWGRMARRAWMGVYFYAPIHGYLMFGWIFQQFPNFTSRLLFTQFISQPLLFGPVSYVIGRLFVELKSLGEMQKTYRPNLLKYSALIFVIWTPINALAFSVPPFEGVFVQSIGTMFWHVIAMLAVHVDEIKIPFWENGSTKPSLARNLIAPFRWSLEWYYSQPGFLYGVLGIFYGSYVLLAARLVYLAHPDLALVAATFAMGTVLVVQVIKNFQGDWKKMGSVTFSMEEIEKLRQVKNLIGDEAEGKNKILDIIGNKIEPVIITTFLNAFRMSNSPKIKNVDDHDLSFVMQYPFLMAVENAIDAYIKKRKLDPGYTEALSLDFYLRDTNIFYLMPGKIQVRMVANGSAFIKGLSETAVKRKDPDYLGGQGQGLKSVQWAASVMGVQWSLSSRMASMGDTDGSIFEMVFNKSGIRRAAYSLLLALYPKNGNGDDAGARLAAGQSPPGEIDLERTILSRLTIPQMVSDWQTDIHHPSRLVALSQTSSVSHLSAGDEVFLGRVAEALPQNSMLIIFDRFEQWVKWLEWLGASIAPWAMFVNGWKAIIMSRVASQPSTVYHESLHLIQGENPKDIRPEMRKIFTDHGYLDLAALLSRWEISMKQWGYDESDLSREFPTYLLENIFRVEFASSQREIFTHNYEYSSPFLHAQMKFIQSYLAKYDVKHEHPHAVMREFILASAKKDEAGQREVFSVLRNYVNALNPRMPLPQSVLRKASGARLSNRQAGFSWMKEFWKSLRLLAGKLYWRFMNSHARLGAFYGRFNENNTQTTWYGSYRLSNVSTNTIVLKKMSQLLDILIRRNFDRPVRILSLGSGRGNLEAKLIELGHHRFQGVDLNTFNAYLAAKKGVPTLVGPAETVAGVEGKFKVLLFSESEGHMNIPQLLSRFEPNLDKGALIFVTGYLEENDVKRKKAIPYKGHTAQQMKEILINEGCEFVQTDEIIMSYPVGKKRGLWILTAKIGGAARPSAGARLVSASAVSVPALKPVRHVRAVSINNYAAVPGLDEFFVGVARAQSFQGARLAVGRSIYNLRKKNGVVTARGYGLPAREFTLKKKAVTTKNAPVSNVLSVSDLTGLDRDVYDKVSDYLEPLEISTEEPEIIEIDAELLNNPSFDRYLEYLDESAEFESSQAYGRNVYYLFTGNAALVERAMNSTGASKIFLKKVPEFLKNAKRIGLADALKPGILNQINIPALKWEEGDVPPLRALIKLAIYAGRIDMSDISQNFRSAYEVLAGGALPDSLTLKTILDGTADAVLRTRFALRPLLRVSINQTLQFFQNMTRMLSQSV